MKLQHLLSKERSTAKKWLRALVAPPRPLATFRQEAEDLIAALPVRSIIPNNWLRAERDASRRARTAFFKGEFQNVATALQQQLLAHELYRAAVKANKEVQRIIAFMKKFETLAKQKKLGKAGHTYLEQILRIMEQYEFRAVSDKKLAKRQSLAEWVKWHEETYKITPQIPERLLREVATGRRNFRQVPFNEILEVFNTVKHIDHLATLKNKLLTAKRTKDFEVAVAEYVASIQANGGKRGKVDPESDRPMLELHRDVKSFFLANVKFASLIRQMDGFKDGGVGWEFIVRAINSAADREAVMREKAAKRLDKMFDDLKVNRRKFYDRNDYIREIGLTLSHQGRLMVALNWGNLDSREKLKEGLAITAGRDAPLTDQQVEAVLRRLTKKDWKFVQEAWDMLDEFWPDIKSLSERIDGIAAPKVEAEPILIDGVKVADGGYFPMAYDPRQSQASFKERAGETADRFYRGETFRATTRHGHREARVTNVKRPVKLGLSVLFNHINDVIHDITHFEALLDINRLLDDTRVRSTIIDHHGDLFFAELRKSVNDVAAGQAISEKGYEQVTNWLRRGATTAVLGWKITTALVQPLGLTSSIVRIGAKWVWRGMQRWMGDAIHMENTVKWVYERSSFMRLRQKTMTREVNEIRNQLRLGGKIVTKVESTALWMTIKAQLVADMPTWLGAHMKALDAMGKANSSEQRKEFEERASALADQAVIDSQGSGHIKDMARVMRGPGFQKLFTMFLTYFNARYNIARESVLKTNFKSPFDIGRLAVDMLILYPLPTIMSVLTLGVLRGAFDEDDRDKLLDQLIADVALDPFNDVVLIREIVGQLKGFRYRGPAGLKVFGEIGDLATQIFQGEFDEGVWRELNDVAGPLFHYPSEQIEAFFRGFSAWTEGDVGVGGILVGPPRK